MTTVGKPWGDEEREALVRYWTGTHSIQLTAIMMGRTTSAIQTAASRFNLPKRELDDDSHRRPWNGVDEANWLRAKKTLATPEGRLPVHHLAVHLKRSVDSVVVRLLKDVDQDREAFLSLIVIPDNDIKLKEFAETIRALKPAADDGFKAEVVDQRKVGKMRKCLSCERNFWSQGAHNRICNRCKGGGDNSY